MLVRKAPSQRELSAEWLTEGVSKVRHRLINKFESKVLLFLRLEFFLVMIDIPSHPLYNRIREREGG